MSITILPGVTRIIKLTPNNSLIPSTIENIDQLFNLSLLSDSKFSEWKSIASTSEKIGVVENDEAPRFIDPNFNISTPVGNIWILGKVEQNHPFYLQTGPSISISDSTSVFTAPQCVASSGYMDKGPINIMNRCVNDIDGDPHSHSLNVTYNQQSKLDKGFGFNGSTSAVIYNEPIGIPLPGKQKFSVKMLMKQTVAGVMSVWADHNVSFFIMMEDLNSVAFSCDTITFMARADFTGVINSDTWFLIDVTGDLTQTDSNITIQNNKRFKVYVNGSPINLIFTGDVPDQVADMGGAFEFGTVGLSFAGALDETRIIIDRTETANEVLWRYNQWFDQANYWTPTIQPIITSVNYINSGRWQIIGTGFKPETINPSGTIGGVVYTIETATDIEVIIQQGAYTPTETQTLVLTNSDTESYNFSIIVPYIAPCRSDFIGMPPIQKALPPGDKLSDTQYGNPNGDVVDNSAGAQPVTDNTINPGGSSGGSCLNMYSKPSWLCS